jgi:hypothetical protein
MSGRHDRSTKGLPKGRQLAARVVSGDGVQLLDGKEYHVRIQPLNVRMCST